METLRSCRFYSSFLQLLKGLDSSSQHLNTWIFFHPTTIEETSIHPASYLWTPIHSQQSLKSPPRHPAPSAPFLSLNSTTSIALFNFHEIAVFLRQKCLSVALCLNFQSLSSLQWLHTWNPNMPMRPWSLAIRDQRCPERAHKETFLLPLLLLQAISKSAKRRRASESMLANFRAAQRWILPSPNNSAVALTNEIQIFTRAEHRRRHELSHKAKKTYTCSFEGCTKAFHRADYLTQHMARQWVPHGISTSLETNTDWISLYSDPDHLVSKSPSLRSNSTSSAVSSAPSQSYTKSPVIAGFHSPVPSTSSRTPTNADQAVVMCSNCYNCQNGAHASHSQSAPLYNYSPSSSMGYFGPQSPPATVNPGLEAVIDQYMRSVLRPEAFLPVQSQDQIGSPFWNSNIDPNLPTMSSSVCFPAS